MTLRLDQLLLEFQKNRVHLAMLLDEYGSVVGMVTLENVLEELVGPIQDEFDREPPAITPLGEGVFEVDASCPLDVLAEHVGIEVPETDAETAGGLILDILGRLARPGDAVEVSGHRLTVLRADPTRIRKIRIDQLRPVEINPDAVKTNDHRKASRRGSGQLGPERSAGSADLPRNNELCAFLYSSPASTTRSSPRPARPS